MRKVYLCDCAPGDLVEDVFVVTNKQLSAASNGKHFIKAFLGDRTATVTARMWNATRQVFDKLPEGFARVRGRVENYQNNLQFIIEQWWEPKEGTYDVADLIPSTTKDVPQMCMRLKEVLGSVQNRHLAAILNAYTSDHALMDRLCKAPAAMSFHHAYLGGLLEHTLNGIEVADCICKFYPGLNRDVVVAGIFLHDIAKTWELTYDCSFGYSDGGQLVGHIVKSAMWVEEKRREAEKALGEPVPQPLVDVLQHIILSHHGELDRGFGSAKTPATPEAWMVHYIDEMDAKLMIALSTTRGSAASGEGNWTEYQKALGGRLYRPDVAPVGGSAEATEQAPVKLEVQADLPAIPIRPGAPANGKDKAMKDEKGDGKATLHNPLFEIKR